MTLFGYARVSTSGQDLGIQETALRAAGCQTVRSEKKSGGERGARTELQVLLDFLRKGDNLMVTRIDRLARSMKDLQDIVHELKGRGSLLRQQSNRSIQARQPEKHFSICWACLQSSRQTFDANGNLKVSRQRRHGASTRAASRVLIPTQCVS